MSSTAFQIQYRQEYIKGFEQRQSLLRDTVTTEAVIKGNQAVFLVADSGGATTTNRGVNGLIPARTDNLTQQTATLSEEHDLVRKTGFNVFASQGDQRRIMQETSMGVVNRKIDSQIITELNTGTIDTGAAVKGSVGLILKAQVGLTNAAVPWDSNITLLCSAALLAYLKQAPEFSKATYVNTRPFAEGTPEWRDMPVAYRWDNILVIPHPNIPGVGTNAEKCFLYHKSAIGHAANTADVTAMAGYDEEQDYSWARTSIFMGPKLLQNTGVIVINHDGSEYVVS